MEILQKRLMIQPAFECLQLKTDRPEGRIAFKGAKIITMNGNEIIESGTIIINGNRVENMGKDADRTWAKMQMLRSLRDAR